MHRAKKMSYKFLGSIICLFLLNILGPVSAAAADRHGDLPFATSWAAFSLGQQAQKESGLEAGQLAVLFLEPDPGWYTYAHEPGGFAKPTRLSASLADTPLRVLYPIGTPKDDLLKPGSKIQAYEGRTPLFVLMPDAKSAGKIAVQLELLLCSKEKCYPARLALSFSMPSGALPDARSQTWWPDLLKAAQRGPLASEALEPGAGLPVVDEKTANGVSPSDWSGLTPRYHQPGLEVGGLVKAVLLGLLAGFILNFMPCVLPVISIKLSALMAGATVADANDRRAKFREHNLYFALGIMLYFLVLSAVLGATDLAWGQIFQQSLIVMGLTALIFVLSLSLLGVFCLPIVDLKFDQMTTHPKLQALFTGLLATLLATPCSGPFLGGVLGWTLLQPPWVISSVLVAIGAGMALPYLVMVLFPGLARLFPKPGPWTGHLEKIVALLLIGTCIYLLSILPSARLIPALVLLWFTAVGAWVWGVSAPGFDSAKDVLLKLAAVILLGLGLWLGFKTPVPSVHLAAFSEASLHAVLGKETVVVDFTADWCPSCKLLEQTTLTSDRLGDMKNRYGLNLMRADLTQNNPEAEALLHALGSKSIPVLAIFPKNAPKSPLVLRDLFTPAQLEDALESTARP
jgi:thiol:disulfide interchange protein